MITTSYFEFSHRTIVKSGAGTRILLPNLIKDLGGKRPVLYTDKGLTNAGITKKIIELFETVPGIQLAGVFEDIQQDAKSTLINQGLQYFKECNGDSIIALGGGSVIDTVKGIKWSLYKNIKDISLYTTGNTFEIRPDAKPMIPHITLPTTAGTGSEVSDAAVIFNEAIGVKCNLRNPYLSSDIAILDPELTIGLPPKITAFTGMDALTHAIEGYFSPKSTPMSDALALHAIRLIIPNIKKAVHQGKNLAARANMLQASSLAITSFMLGVSVIPVHNVAHAFGAKYGIPHGLANSVLLPNIMENLPFLYIPKIKGFSEALGLKNASDNPEECLAECIEAIRALRTDIHLPDTFEEYNIDANDVSQVVVAVQSDPSGLSLRIPEAILAKIFTEVIGTKVPAN